MITFQPKFLFLQYKVIGIFYKLLQFFRISIPPFASSSCIIINKLNEILVVNLSYKRGYALPGGLLKPHESFEQALVREVKEETNLVITVGELVGLYHSYDEFPTVNALYTATIKHGQIHSSAEGKVSWKKPQKIINRIAHSDNRQGIKEYFEI